MKKSMVVLAMLFLSSVSAQAQMGEQKEQAGQGMMMGEGQQMQMMQMCMPMMKQMMGQGMMMQDMMQMMTDMMKMQQKTMEGVKPAEKKELTKELSGMQEKMNKMMADMKGMMSQGMMSQDMMMQGMTDGAASAEAKEGEKIDSSLKTQEREEAGVTAKASLESRNGAITFKIVLETHTVDLEKYKFDEIVVLRAAGKEHKARLKSLEGSGHHRSAVIEFDNPKAKEVEIVIKDVAGVKERLFKF